MLFLNEQIPDACLSPWKEKCEILRQLVVGEAPSDLFTLKFNFSTVLRELKAGGCNSDLVLCFAHAGDSGLVRHVAGQFDDPIVSIKQVSFTDMTGGPYGYIYLKKNPESAGIYSVHRFLMVLPKGSDLNTKSYRFHFETLLRWGTNGARYAGDRCTGARYTGEYLNQHFTAYKELVISADAEYKILTTRVVTKNDRRYLICNKAQPEVTRWMDRGQIFRELGEKGVQLLKDE